MSTSGDDNSKCNLNLNITDDNYSKIINGTYKIYAQDNYNGNKKQSNPLEFNIDNAYISDIQITSTNSTLSEKNNTATFKATVIGNGQFEID